MVEQLMKKLLFLLSFSAILLSGKELELVNKTWSVLYSGKASSKMKKIHDKIGRLRDGDLKLSRSCAILYELVYLCCSFYSGI